MERVRFHVTMSLEAIERVDAEIARAAETGVTLKRGDVLGQLAMKHLGQAPRGSRPAPSRGPARRYPVPKKATAGATGAV